MQCIGNQQFTCRGARHSNREGNIVCHTSRMRAAQVDSVHWQPTSTSISLHNTAAWINYVVTKFTFGASKKVKAASGADKLT